MPAVTGDQPGLCIHQPQCHLLLWSTQAGTITPPRVNSQHRPTVCRAGAAPLRPHLAWAEPQGECNSLQLSLALVAPPVCASTCFHWLHTCHAQGGAHGVPVSHK